MSHGYSLLEIANSYEKQAKELAKITEDILFNDKQYYGVMSVGENFDLLIGLCKHHSRKNIEVSIWRGWPEKEVIASTDSFTMYFGQAIKMFPEMKMVKYERKWPKPYNAP